MATDIQKFIPGFLNINFLVPFYYKTKFKVNKMFLTSIKLLKTYFNDTLDELCIK